MGQGVAARTRGVQSALRAVVNGTTNLNVTTRDINQKKKGESAVGGNLATLTYYTSSVSVSAVLQLSRVKTISLQLPLQTGLNSKNRAWRTRRTTPRRVRP